MNLYELDYIFLTVTVLLFIEDLKLVLKIAGKDVNRIIFLVMMLTVSPVITIVLFVMVKYTGVFRSDCLIFDKMKPVGIWILLTEAEILHQYEKEFFYEKHFVRLLGGGTVLILLPILTLKSLCRLNKAIYALFNCVSVAYIVLACYYESKKEAG